MSQKPPPQGPPPPRDSEEKRERGPIPQPSSSLTGRSGNLADIGRELGVLDFEPDDLLASLEPMPDDNDAGSAFTIPEAPTVPRNLGDTDPPKSAAPTRPTPPGSRHPVSIAPISSSRFGPPFPSAKPTNLGGPASRTDERAPQPELPAAPPAVEPRASEQSKSLGAASAERRSSQPRLPTTAPKVPLGVRGPLGAERSASVTSQPHKGSQNPPEGSGLLRPSAERTARPAPRPPAPSTVSGRPSSPAASSRLPRPAPKPNTLPERPPIVVLPPEAPLGPIEHTMALELGDRGALSPSEPPSESDVPDLVVAPASADDADESLFDALFLLDTQSIDDERPASQHAEERQLATPLRKIAERLLGEVESMRDPNRRARLALLGSELFAIVGDHDGARRIVSQPGGTTTTSWLTQQHRALLRSTHDFSGFVQSLQAETRSHQTGPLRRHALLLLADASLIERCDDGETLRRLDLAARAFPTDPRPRLLRLVSQLSSSTAPPKVRPSAGGTEDPLSSVTQVVAELRSAEPGSRGTHPALLLAAARQALTHTISETSLATVARLAEIPDLALPSAWLTATLGSLMVGAESAVGAALARLIQSGDPEAALARLEMDVARGELGHNQLLPSSLSIADQLLVSLLGHADTHVIAALAQSAESQPATRALGLVVQALLENRLVRNSEHSPREQADTLLGHALIHLNRAPQTFDLALEAKRSVGGDDVLIGGVAFLSHLWQGDFQAVKADLEALPASLLGLSLCERHLVSGFFSLALGAEGAARRSMQAALTANPSLTVAAHYLLCHSSSTERAALFEELASQATEPRERAFLLTEAALYLDPAAQAEQKRLFVAADALDGSCPITSFFAEHLARVTGSAVELRAVLERRLSRAEEPREIAITSWQLARVLPDSEGATRARLIASTLEYLPEADALRRAALVLDPDAVPFEARREFARSSQGSGSLSLVVPVVLAATRAQDADALTEALALVGQHTKSPIAEVWARRESKEQALVDAEELTDSSLPLPETPQTELLALLRKRESSACADQRLNALSAVARQLGELLDRNERLAHSWLYVWLSQREGRLTDALSTIERAARDETAPLWALRRLYAYARESADDRRLLEVGARLGENATRALDAATLSLRNAEAAARLNRQDEVVKHLRQAVELVPSHLVALSMRAEILEALGESTLAAECYDALGSAAAVPAHRVAAFREAAQLWTNLPSETGRALASLERALEIEPTHLEASRALWELLRSERRFEDLEQVLLRQLAHTTDVDEQLVLEIERARTLWLLSRIPEARLAIDHAIELGPTHQPALILASDLAIADDDWDHAYVRLSALLELVRGSKAEGDVLLRIANLEEKQLGRPAEAETTYKKLFVLRHDPESLESLLSCMGRNGHINEGIELLETLIESAETPELERARLIRLAAFVDGNQNDRERAETILERARRKWPYAASPLEALADLYRTHGETLALDPLLEKTATEARRALGTGRFDLEFFEAIATVAKLRGHREAEAASRATLAALEGGDTSLSGVGLVAADPDLDDVLAPEQLSLPLRALLLNTGHVLSQVHPVDLRALAATPLEELAYDWSQEIRQMAAEFRVSNLELYASERLGAAVLPGSSEPPVLVVGRALIEQPGAEREFLVIRALKVISVHGTTFFNTAPIDLGPLLAAYLGVFLPDYAPSSGEPARVVELRERLTAALGDRVEAAAVSLASDVAQTIGNQVSQLGIAISQWASRTALLALGDPSAALRALHQASQDPDPWPEAGAPRIRWVVRHAEARDLMVFSASEPYLSARQRAQKLAATHPTKPH